MVAALVWCSAVAAASHPVTIVLVGEPARAFERELSAEASEAGLVVVSGAPSDAARSPAELGAAATLRVVSPDRVEIWYAPKREEAPARAPADFGPGERDVLVATADGSERFATRVIEQVRARLVTLSLLPEPQATSVPPASPAPQPTPEPPARPPPLAGASARRHVLWVETGVAATAAAGGLPAAIQALVGLRASLGSIDLEVFGLLPLTDGNIQAAEGSADVMSSLIAASASYRLSDEDSVLQGSLGAGAGALFVTMEGEALAPYRGREESLATGAFFLDGGVRYRPAQWLGVRASTLVGLYAPRPVVEFAGHEVAALGRTFGTLMLTLEFGPSLAGDSP